MDFAFSEEQQMVRETVRRFVEKELRPLEAEVLARVQAQGRHGELLPPEVQEGLRGAVAEMGLWAMSVPGEFGGGGFDTLSVCLVEEELGKTFVLVDLGDVSPLLFECAPGQRERYLQPTVAGEKRCCLALREPDQQMEPGAMATRAQPGHEGYVLIGRKLCGPEGASADFFLVFAAAPEGPSAFLVDRDTEGVRIAKRAEGPGVDLILEGAMVPFENLLGELGRGLALGRRWFPTRVVKTGARYVGMTNRLLEMAATYAKSWETFGRPLSERPAVQRVLAEMAVGAESARWMVYRGAWMVDRGLEAEDESIEVGLCTWSVLRRAIDGAIQVHGGPNYDRDLPMLRIYQGTIDDHAMEHMLERLRYAVSARVWGLAA